MTAASAPPAWRESRLKRWQATAIGVVGFPLIDALGRTLRWRAEGLHHLDAVAAAGHQPIIGFWHGRILPGTLYFQGRGIIVMTSENFDGEWIARIIHRFGYSTARGSTSRGGSKALRQLIREVSAGRGAGITLDGPRGPARIAQPGALWLAMATGHPVVPIHFEASTHWTLPSWDRTQIPKPFATVSVAVGEPLYVPRDAGADAIEAARTALEQRLAQLEGDARRIAGDRT
jgi:lysophospholipid acyltransferase (LPLAT)-like uncharacterized protein